MTKRKGGARQQIRIIFETSVLYTGSASDLMRDEIAQFISQAQSNITDLNLRWYIPDVVLHERHVRPGSRPGGGS